MWFNQSRTDQETLSRLWDVLDDPHLNKAEVAAVVRLI